MRFSLSVILLLFSKSFIAQNIPPTLDLKFDSEFEQIVIEGVIEESNQLENVGFIDALLAMDNSFNKAKSLEVQKRLINFVTDIATRTATYKPKKKVKYVFEEAHDQFFRKYELDAGFSDIFKSGIYNCVTGTALYAFLFEEMNIPFQIKETPTHVFLIAYPESDNILVETTLPGAAGSYAPSEIFIRKAVDQLVEMKLMGQLEVEQMGYNKAFNDYYYGEENISKKDLVGIQYYNKAIFHMNNQNLKDGFFNMEKSKFLYRNKKTELFNESILTYLVNEMDFAAKEDFQWFVRLTKVSKDEAFLKYKLESMLIDGNWSDDDLDGFQKELENLENKELKDQLSELFYWFRARHSYKLQNFDDAIDFSFLAYQINENNLDAKNFIASLSIERLSQKNLSESRLEEVRVLVEKYPFIPEFEVFDRYQCFLYSYLVANAFKNNRGLTGEKYLADLESILKNDDGSGIGYNQELIGNAYGEVGAYYYRQGNKKQAVENLKRGLEFSPENNNITRKLKLINNSY